MRRFDTLVPALNENRGEAVIASIAVNGETRKAMDFTDPYYRVPARFASLKAAATPILKPEQLEGKKIGVVGGSAHEAYLKALFTEAQPVGYLSADATREALAARRGRLRVRRWHRAVVLDQRHRFRRLLRIRRRAVLREPVFRGRRRHRGARRATIPCVRR